MNKLVLILNCGSSSLKFAVIAPESGDELLSGLAECLGLADARIKWNLSGKKGNSALSANANHQIALDFIINDLLSQEQTIQDNLVAIGHRIVHGGEQFAASVIIDDAVMAGIEGAIPFAPLHNPAGLVGIKAALAAFPALAQKNVAVFDTAFHQTLPQEAYLYALPYELYEKHGIRRYGFHGTSHRFIAEQAAERLQKPLNTLNIINCHLGNGASVCAIKNGQSVDTSMGLTPLEGLAMGTRCGDIDPAIIFFLHNTLGHSLADIDTLLTRQSGLLGLTQETSDCRYATDNYDTIEGAKRATDVFAYRVAKYVAAYTAALDGRLDAITFTGGIGENAALIRELVLKRLGLLGVTVDVALNDAAFAGKHGLISAADSRIPVWVIPTNEELVIAQDAFKLV